MRHLVYLIDFERVYLCSLNRIQMAAAIYCVVQSAIFRRCRVGARNWGSGFAPQFDKIRY